MVAPCVGRPIALAGTVVLAKPGQAVAAFVTWAPGFGAGLSLLPLHPEISAAMTKENAVSLNAGR